MGTTYTRQESGNITDGSTIEASHFNNEFNQIESAFASSTGHTHDGTTGEGGPITKLLGTALTIGDGTAATDIAVTFDGETNDGLLTWMEDEDYFKFSDDILVNSTEKLQFRDTALYINSSTDGQLDIVADTEVQIATTTLDINADADVSGTLTYGSLSDGSITITAFVDEDDMTSDSATLVPTQQSVKAYVDAQITAADLDFQGDSGGALSIDLDSEVLDIAGGTGIDTSGSGNTLTVAIDSTVATLTGSQTLTNKTLTTPIISSISNTGTLTLPTSTDTLVGRATTDTLTNKTLTSAVLNTGVSGTAVLDEDNMASDSATQLATQQSIKAYVDAQVATSDTLAEVLSNGNTSGGTNLVIDSGDTLDVNGSIDLDGDLTVDNGASGTIRLNGNLDNLGNVAFGYSSLSSGSLTGFSNTAIGSVSLPANTSGDNNVAVGSNTLQNNTTGSNNIAIGKSASDSSTTSSNIVAIGSDTLTNNSADNNVGIGHQALRANTTGDSNTALGYHALTANLTGGALTAVGQQALSSNTTGGSNTALGYQTLTSVSTGSNNTGLGRKALGLTTSSGNTAVGYEAGNTITTGAKNTILGVYNGNESSLDIRTSSNNVVIADGDANIRFYANSSGDVGIGTISPTEKLEVNGNVKITGDLTVSGDDITMGTNTDTAIMVADGTNFNPVVPSGDVGLTNAGVFSISSGVIVNDDINASAAIAYSKLNLSDSIVNADINSSAAIADSKLATISTANKVSVDAVDIDGATDIGADLTTSDLIVVDDGAGGTNRKAALSRLTTYMTGQGFSTEDPTALAIALG